MLTLGWPPAPAFQLPLSLPAPLGSFERDDQSIAAQEHRAATAHMVATARQEGTHVFEWRRSGADCWFLGLPYQDAAAVVRPGCKQTQPPWFPKLAQKLWNSSSGTGDDFDGLAPEQWLGCAFQAAVKLNATRVAHAFGNGNFSTATMNAKSDSFGADKHTIKSKSSSRTSSNNAESPFSNDAKGSAVARDGSPACEVNRAIAIHVRTGSSDFGDDFEAELAALLTDSHDGLYHSRWDVEPPLASPFDGALLANKPHEAAPGGESKPLLPQQSSMEAWRASKRTSDLRTAGRAAHLAAECASNLTRATNAAGSILSSATTSGTVHADAGAPSQPIRWVIASDSAAVRALLSSAAEAAGAQPWSAIPEYKVASTAGKTGGGASHHTRYRDITFQSEGRGDAEAAAELFALGGDFGEHFDNDSGDSGGGTGDVGALLATYGSVVTRGSAFAALAAARGNMPRVFVHGPPERRNGEHFECTWVNAKASGSRSDSGKRDSARPRYPAGLGEL